MGGFGVLFPHDAFGPGLARQRCHAGNHLGFAVLHIVRQAGIDREAMRVTLRISRLQFVHLRAEDAHDGVAVGECMTYSIGFRAPAFQELGEAFLQFMADTIDLPGRYADPDLEVSKHPAEISRTMLAQVADELNKVKFTEDDIAIFLGEYLSEPKARTYFTPPARPLTAARFEDGIAKRGVSLSRKTQMLYRGKHVFINGESFAAGRADKTTLCLLADQRHLDGASAATSSQDVKEALYTWYQDGWLSVG